MAKPLLDDELWNLIEPLIPKKRRRFRYPGRKPMCGWAAFPSILFVLPTGITGEYLTNDMGCRAGMTGWPIL